MNGFLKSVWNKIHRVASWIKEQLVDAIPDTSVLISMALAKTGGYLSKAFHNLACFTDDICISVASSTVNYAMKVFRAFYHTVTLLRKAVVTVAVLLSHVFSSVGLILQTPYLNTVSKTLLKDAWKTQWETITFRNGLNPRVVIAEVTWADYKALKELRREEKATVNTKPAGKGRSTPKQAKSPSPTRVFNDAVANAGLAAV